MTWPYEDRNRVKNIGLKTGLVITNDRAQPVVRLNKDCIVFVLDVST